MSRVSIGRVESFSPEKGHGVVVLDCGRRIFVHYSAFIAEGVIDPASGARVIADWYEVQISRYHGIATRVGAAPLTAPDYYDAPTSEPCSLCGTGTVEDIEGGALCSKHREWQEHTEQP